MIMSNYENERYRKVSHQFCRSNSITAVALDNSWRYRHSYRLLIFKRVGLISRQSLLIETKARCGVQH